MVRAEPPARSFVSRGETYAGQSTFYERATSVRLLSNGQLYVSWGVRQPALWQVAEKRLRLIKPVAAPPATSRWKWQANWNASTFSPDARWLVNGGWPLQWWRVEGTRLRRAHTVEAGAVTGFSPDSRFFSTQLEPASGYATAIHRTSMAASCGR